MSEVTLKQRLLVLAEQLEEVGDISDEYSYSEIGDMFATWGSGELQHIASQLRRIAKEYGE